MSTKACSLRSACCGWVAATAVSTFVATMNNNKALFNEGNALILFQHVVTIFPPHVGHKLLLFSAPRWARNVTFLPAARWATNITFFQHRVGHQIKRISCPTLASTEACLYPSAALPASLQSVWVSQRMDLVDGADECSSPAELPIESRLTSTLRSTPDRTTTVWLRNKNVY